MNPPPGPLSVTVWWLCAYWPVSMETRDGAQIGVGAMPWVKVVPRRASSLRVFGMTARSEVIMSSTVNSTTLGGFGAADPVP